jgi:predicted outer membrane repeat protein
MKETPMPALPKAFFALIGAATLAASAHAATYRIGSGCAYASLGAAMTYAAANDFDAQVVFQLRTGTQVSGLYGPTYGYASIEVIDPRWDMVIEGGFGDCLAAVPTGYTALATSRAGDGMLLVENSLAVRHTVAIRRLHFVDASDTQALFFWDNVTAALGAGVEVSNNGGGISLATQASTPSATWPQLTLGDGARVHDNQGSGIAGLGTVTLAGASIDHNQAVSGAGIYLSGSESQLILDSNGGDNSITENLASAAGGGIYLDHASLLTLAATSGVNNISLNQAGASNNLGFGYGGGICSDGGNIEFHSGAADAGQHNVLDSNYANYGGAIAVVGANAGAGVSYTFVSLLNTRFSSNQAYVRGGALYSRNAVDWIIDRGSLSGCDAGFFAPCSVFANNAAHNANQAYDPATPQPNGGVIYLTDERGDGYSRGIARFYHTYFANNSDDRGSAAVAAATSSAELVFQRDIFTGNTAYVLDVGTNLIDSRNTKNLNFRYNTVLPSNYAYYVLHTLGGTADLTGSIIETPELLGVPVPIWRGEGSAQVVHRGCLVSLTALTDANGAGGWVGDARVGATDYAPAGGSPAIDHCDFTPPIDFYGYAGAVDTQGVPARFGDYDLGAVEQRDIIFYNDFGIRPNG